MHFKIQVGSFALLCLPINLYVAVHSLFISCPYQHLFVQFILFLIFKIKWRVLQIKSQLYLIGILVPRPNIFTMHEIKFFKKVNKTLSTGSTLQNNNHLLQPEMDMTLFIQYCLYVLGSIHHFHIDHNAPCLPPPPPTFCITIVFVFSWDDWEIGKKSYANFGR